MQWANEAPTTKQLDRRELEKRDELVEQLLSFPLRDDLVKSIQIGSLLLLEEKNQQLDFL